MSRLTAVVLILVAFLLGIAGVLVACHNMQTPRESGPIVHVTSP